MLDIDSINPVIVIRLAIAKFMLVRRLKKCSIDFLLQEMSNRSLYSSLLKKRQQNGLIKGDDYISWYAYERARKLKLSTEKERLMIRLRLENNPKTKEHIYFCLANYCRNTSDYPLFDYLMKCLENEIDSSYQQAILIPIEYMNKPVHLHIEPLKKMAKVEGKFLVQYSVIAALKNTNDDAVEDILIVILVDTKDNHIKSGIVHTLSTIGTKKCVPFLKEIYQKSRDYGLRTTIISTIEKIENPEEFMSWYVKSRSTRYSIGL